MGMYDNLMPAGSTCKCGRRALSGKTRCRICQTELMNDKHASQASMRTPEFNRLRREMLVNATCACGRPANTIDHIIPRARGGTNDRSNLRPMCAECNARKGARVEGHGRADDR